MSGADTVLDTLALMRARLSGDEDAADAILAAADLRVLCEALAGLASELARSLAAAVRGEGDADGLIDALLAGAQAEELAREALQ